MLGSWEETRTQIRTFYLVLYFLYLLSLFRINLSFKESIKGNDDLSIKVKRYNPNSLSNRIGRWWDGQKHPTEKENHFFPAPNFKEHTHNCGFLTAAARRWDDGEYEDWFYLCKNKHNLLTNGGRDFFHKQCYSDLGASGSSAFAPGSAWIAVSATSFTPATNDTVLNSELTAGTGFARMLGTFAHSAGTNATTVTGTFTCATAPQNNVQSSGLFTQLAVGGTLTHEANFTSTNFAINDQLQITWTLNLG